MENSFLPNVTQSVPFFMVRSMKSSLDFYVHGLGFEVKGKWEPNGTIEWCWLEHGKAALMLQEYRAGMEPAGTRGVGVSVCFICNDAIAIYKEALSRKLTPEEPFVGNASWVVQFKDPDGYVVLFESPTEVKEGTKYGEAH